MWRVMAAVVLLTGCGKAPSPVLPDSSVAADYSKVGDAPRPGVDQAKPTTDTGKPPVLDRPAPPKPDTYKPKADLYKPKADLPKPKPDLYKPKVDLPKPKPDTMPACTAFAGVVCMTSSRDIYGQCEYHPKYDTCYIAGVCYVLGDKKPGDPCSMCLHAPSSTWGMSAWTKVC